MHNVQRTSYNDTTNHSRSLQQRDMLQWRNIRAENFWLTLVVTESKFY